MKVFTDSTETTFFKTDKYIKNLHEIEIDSIDTFVNHYSLDSLILIDVNSWMVGRYDELFSGNPVIDQSEEPDLHGEWLKIDFVKDMDYLDILVEISKHVNFDSDYLAELKNGFFEIVENEWINDDADEKWTVKAWNDPRILEIVIDSSDNVTLNIYNDDDK